MSNEETLEKVEQIREILVSRATGMGVSDADAEAYQILRDELLAMPDIKRGLPRYVTTCKYVGQFWDYLKREHADLKSYQSRREKIWDDFKPLVSVLQDDNSTDLEKFFPKNSEHEAYTHIRAILQTAKRELLIIDGYMDTTMFTVLSTLTGNVSIRLLTSKPPIDFAHEAAKCMLQHKSLKIEIRKARDFHDRFIFVDRKQCYLLGASIKDAGGRGFVIVPLNNTAVTKILLEHAEMVWDAGTVILGEEEET